MEKKVSQIWLNWSSLLDNLNEMNKKTIILISGFIALSLVLSFVALNRTPGTKTIVQSDGTKTELGAVHAFSPTPELNLGGTRLVGTNRATLVQASTTVCAIQAPAATSTLISAGIRFTLASTSAVIVDFAKDSTQYSTTTQIGTTYSIAASAQATIIASTTGSVSGDATLFEPNYWFVSKMEGAAKTSLEVGNAPTGSCYAIWAVI